MDIIAQRRLELRIDGKSIEVAVKLGKPAPTEDNENWICPYEIWIGDECRSMAMHGVDAMQALQLSIATLDVELEFAARKRGGTLFHHDEPFVSILDGGNLKVRE